jgi:acyl-CoA synthetase (AMP-forming)/AMP-acid ligase II
MVTEALHDAPPRTCAAAPQQARCPELATVPECVEYHARREPQALACAVRVQGEWQRISRAELWSLVERYAALFASALESSTLVLFIKKPDVHLLAAYLGAMKAGHVPAQVSPPTTKMSVEEYRRKIDHVREITHCGAIFTDDDAAGMHEGAVLSPSRLTSAPSPVPHVLAPRREALAQFSSGTTGLQKGVFLSHAGLVAHMRSYAEAVRLTADDVLVSWLPLYHDMGLIACYLMPLTCGIPFHQMDPFDWLAQPDALLATVERERGTICYLPNFAYKVLVDKGRPHDLSSVRLWINCSEPARTRSHEAFRARFPSVRPEALTVCYALAENTFAATQTLPWEGNSTRIDATRNVLSCGRPVRDVEVRIFPAEGLSDGEIGLRSPFLFDRFLDGSRPLCDGFYLTGDLGYVDDRGELFVTGRKKDLVIVHGKNVYPQDVEDAASTVPGVYPGRAAAFGLWNEATGSEDLVVLVERKDGAAPVPLKIAVQRAVQEEVGIVPARVDVLEHMSLVKTTSGKVSRGRNRELYLAKELVVL